VAKNQILYYYLEVSMPSTVTCSSELYFGGGSLSLIWEFTNEDQCDFFMEVCCVLYQPSRGIAFVFLEGSSWGGERGNLYARPQR